MQNRDSTLITPNRQTTRQRMLAADYCLQLLINEYGGERIDTLSHLLALTSSVEIELTHYYVGHPA